MIDYLKPIPENNNKIKFSVDLISVRQEEIPFVEVMEGDRILVDMQYIKDGIPNATSKCYVRQDVYNRLVRASEKLPDGCRFRILDAWRPFSVQEYLYLSIEKMLMERFNYLDKSELEELVRTYVSPPSNSIILHPAHTTGGSIDLTVVDEKGCSLDMGCNFDEFSELAHTSYFEGSECYSEVQNNRRMLYNVMISEGFTNLPSEWWHYDYGNSFWAFYSGQSSKYYGVFLEEEVERKLRGSYCDRERIKIKEELGVIDGKARVK
jgi:D-alanyl-D-alanine dipeptidase